MTYLEIIEWIEEHVTYIEMLVNDKYRIDYIDDNGINMVEVGKDLISIVLEINNEELIK